MRHANLRQLLKLIGPRLPLLFLLTTTADATPLRLKCEGEWRSLKNNQQSEPAAISVTVDGPNITVEGWSARISSDADDVWTFGDANAALGVSGTLNRVTGLASILMKFPSSILLWFEGACQKAERLF